LETYLWTFITIHYFNINCPHTLLNQLDETIYVYETVYAANMVISDGIMHFCLIDKPIIYEASVIFIHNYVNEVVVINELIIKTLLFLLFVDILLLQFLRIECFIFHFITLMFIILILVISHIFLHHILCI